MTKDYLYVASLEHKITELEEKNKKLEEEKADLKERIKRCIETIRKFESDT